MISLTCPTHTTLLMCSKLGTKYFIVPDLLIIETTYSESGVSLESDEIKSVFTH